MSDVFISFVYLIFIESENELYDHNKCSNIWVSTIHNPFNLKPDISFYDFEHSIMRELRE
jgi:hypothetical protein